jgi:hypothetical protein
MIELGIPILIIVTILLQVHVPHLVPLITVCIMVPTGAIALVYAIVKGGKGERTT